MNNPLNVIKNRSLSTMTYNPLRYHYGECSLYLNLSAKKQKR